MKKYIFRIFIAFLAIAVTTSCTEDEGTDPGNDSSPVITLYKYKVSKPLNPDNDVILRLAANSPTSEAYYLVEKTTDRNDHITSMGEEGYKDYVVSNGIKVNDISGESNADITLTDLFGEYTITVVAVGGGSKTSTATVFNGLDWTDVAAGTYVFATQSVGGTPSASVSGMPSHPTTLQICTTDDKLYRFKDVFGTGYHVKINLLNLKGTDADGEYTFFRVPVADTPFTFGSHGAVGIRDIGYWQNNDAFVTENGYESGMYADHSCFVFIQYFVSAGNVGYGYDMFIPD